MSRYEKKQQIKRKTNQELRFLLALSRVFWHQQFRQSVTSCSFFIAHTLLQLPRTSRETSPVTLLLARYTKIFVAFLLSGLVHLCSDQILGIPLRDSGAITFFSLQAL